MTDFYSSKKVSTFKEEENMVSPNKSTLLCIRQFARIYHTTQCGNTKVAMILN